MKLELILAGRLSLQFTRDSYTSDKGFTSPGVKIAIAGIAISYIIMLLTISIVKGFKTEITDKITGFEQQITITSTKDYGEYLQNQGIRIDSTLIRTIKNVAPHASISLSFIQPAMLKTYDDFEGLLFKGFDNSSAEIDFIKDYIIKGEIPDLKPDDNKNPIIISQRTASYLKLDIDDDIIAHFFINEKLLSRKMTVSAIYDTHFGDYDKIYSFVPLRLLQKINKVDSLTGTAINVNGLPTENIDHISEILQNSLNTQSDDITDKAYFVSNVNEKGTQYFSWLSLLDTNVLVILILMGAVSAFTLVSSLFIITLQRVSTIGLLKSLGLSNSGIRKIFILMATKILIYGLVIGNVIGLGLIWLQYRFKIFPLDPDAYFLNFVPVRLDWWIVVILNAAIIVGSVILMILPSQLISKISPAQTMRYD